MIPVSTGLRLAFVFQIFCILLPLEWPKYQSSNFALFATLMVTKWHLPISQGAKKQRDTGIQTQGSRLRTSSATSVPFHPTSKHASNTTFDENRETLSAPITELKQTNSEKFQVFGLTSQSVKKRKEIAFVVLLLFSRFVLFSSLLTINTKNQIRKKLKWPRLKTVPENLRLFRSRAFSSNLQKNGDVSNVLHNES